jgi:hypothetical protein
MDKATKLPEFLNGINEKTIRKNEKEIINIHIKLLKISKIFSNSYFKDKTNKTFLPRIATNISYLTTFINKIITSPNKITFENYLKLLTDIVNEFEILVVSNVPYFYNKTLCKHYKEVYNEILINTSAAAVLNYCYIILNIKE